MWIFGLMGGPKCMGLMENVYIFKGPSWPHHRCLRCGCPSMLSVASPCPSIKRWRVIIMPGRWKHWAQPNTQLSHWGPLTSQASKLDALIVLWLYPSGSLETPAFPDPSSSCSHLLSCVQVKHRHYVVESLLGAKHAEPSNSWSLNKWWGIQPLELN